MSRRMFDAAAIGAIFIAALVSSLRVNGTSPIAWSDMLNDESAVRQCIVDDACAATGTGTSFRNFAHAVGWFELRSLLEWLGLGLDGSHVVIQVSNAIAATLVFAIARRLGGRLAGVLAGWLFLNEYALLRIETAALYNSPPLPFLGAIFLLTCMAVVERPGIVAITLAALVAAIMTNIHLACILSGVSVVCAGFLAPRRRLALATFGALVFALATYKMAPQLWRQNAAVLFQPAPSLGNVAAAARMEGFTVLFWSLLAAVTWISSLPSRSSAWVRYRQQTKGALAVTVPFITAFLVAGFVGIDATAKYLAHILAAMAVAAALMMAQAGRHLSRILLAGKPDSWRQSALSAIRAAPFAMIVVLPLTTRPAADYPPTMRELRAVSHVLHERGFTAQQLVANVKSSSGVVTSMALRELAIVDRFPEADPKDPTASAVLLPLVRADLPDPLPGNWILIRDSHPISLVLIVTHSRIDWSRFHVCLRLHGGGEDTCRESGLLFDKAAPGIDAHNMPRGGPHWSGTLTLLMPVRAALAQGTEAVFMPRMSRVCGGRIAGPTNGALRIASDHRDATISAADVGAGSVERIELEWALGARECQDNASYDGWPPFIVAGDAETVRLVETILRKHEPADGM